MLLYDVPLRSFRPLNMETEKEAKLKGTLCEEPNLDLY